MVIINFYCKEAEKENLKEISQKLGLSLSAFIRTTALKRLREEQLILKQHDQEISN